ncbi:MAG TPA: selenocysteine-specific translation elongation factor [Gemmatimonadales bacterium]|nr:selenocysteine-specific translation elongation factor [Gemmatimonadales bacterium]
MIVGTAGHIDHGKSALVTALTGQAMDRLAEERRRGITIDLNFAPLELGPELSGIVDVPGHEDFVRTMVAGASGIDLALLVVAADEGLMPQTEEHLAILEQLGVPAGIPVVTKADLAEPEWVELVAAELRERLSRSSVSFDDPVIVSARTGQGMDRLRERLAAHAHSLPPRPLGDLFRMPVDRAFSVAGVGTVVTGTAWSGRLEVGAPVALLPGAGTGRVRSIESFRRSVSRSEPGARTAVGIAGLAREEAARGMMLVASDAPWVPATALDVELVLERSAPRPLGARARVRLHLGTAEVMARVSPRGAIEPGGRGLARLALEQPVVARGGDRFVLRSYSPVGTIGGGRVLDPLPPRRRALWPGMLAETSLPARLLALVERRPLGVPSPLLPVLLGSSPAASTALAREAAGVRPAGDVWVSSEVLSGAAARALDLLRQHHRSHPSERGMPLETLRHALRTGNAITETVLADLVRTGRVRHQDGLATLAGFAPRVEGGDREIDRIVAIVEAAALSPPSLAELERQTGRKDVAAVLRLAAAAGRVEAVERDRYYARAALDRFVETLTELGRDATIAPGPLRDRLGISRKYLIPLLEWADGKGVTVRVADGRRLRQGAGSGGP